MAVTTVNNPTAERAAKIGIGIQFLALVRILAEYFRLKHFNRPALTLAGFEPYITGALIAAVLTAASVGLFLWRKYWHAAFVSAAMVVILLVYKLLVMS